MTKPKLDVIQRSEQRLSEDIDHLVEAALETTEIIEVEG